MRLARFTFYDRRGYVVLGPVLNKSLEVGGGRNSEKNRNLDVNVRFTTKGDHAGLKVYVGWWKFMFEVNLTDTRHWDWAHDRFFKPGEEPRFEGYPHE